MSKERLLVVDDERDFVDVISERLGAKGFDILRAFDGKEGFDKARSEKPDLIILDITMPEMNGYDVCKNLKLDENFKNIPIIILTVRFEPNDIVFGKTVGADAYLSKPLDLELLLHTVNMLLGAKKRQINRKTFTADSM